MTIYRAPIFRTLPPTAEFWAKYLGSEGAEQYPLQGIVVHFFYGTVGGAVFGPLFRVVDQRTGLSRETVGVATGFVYGVVLSLFGLEIVFRHVLDRRARTGTRTGVPRRPRRLRADAGHVGE